MELFERPRRLRRTPALRALVRETRLSAASLIWPLFVVEGKEIKKEIPSLPGQYHYSADTLPAAAQEAMEAGVRAFILFGLPNPEQKDERGSAAWNENGVVQRGLRALRAACPGALLLTDVCMCEYTSHGHCGILNGREVDNDATLPYLAQIAVSHARAGADVVAPSDMMDGRVAAIRRALDGAGFDGVAVLSYAVKYASAFYGPFRDAAGSAPAFGDRRGYQMDPHNAREALREARLDVREGADMLMVKPALAYLDVVRAVRDAFDLPLCTYSVSGEYAMIKAAASAGLIDEYRVLCESAVAAYRAGADFYITYYAKELAYAIAKGDIG